MSRPVHLLAALFVLLLGACAHGGRTGDGGVERGAFVTRLGADTVSIERYTRTRDSLIGDIVLRAPRTRIVHYAAALGPDGRITRLESTARPVAEGPGAPPSQTATTVIGADSVRTTITLTGQAPRTIAVAAEPGTVPIIAAAWGLYEQGARQARAMAGDSVAVPFAFTGQRKLDPTPFVKVGADSMTIWYFGPYYRARVDAQGRLLGVNGLGTTNKVVVDRISDVDISAVAQRFSAADAGGRALGQISPRDSVLATIGGAHVMVNYGRPSLRGRQLMGFLVPYGEVWRTGANAATGFTTDADLVMGGVTIPAGKYTLWTISTAQGTQLIVNKQTGQWGTEYKAENDLARIGMTRETVSQPTEQFTIAVTPQGDGGVLRMNWGTVQMSVPFTVAPRS